MRPIVEARDASARFGGCNEGLGRHQSVISGRDNWAFVSVRDAFASIKFLTTAIPRRIS